MKRFIIMFFAIVAFAATLLWAFNSKTGPTWKELEHVRAMADIQSFSAALFDYKKINSFLPTTEQGLNAMVTQPQTEPRPQHWQQQIDSIPLDPWGSKYIYIQPGKHNPKSFDLYSAGPDGIYGNADDVKNW